MKRLLSRVWFVVLYTGAVILALSVAAALSVLTVRLGVLPSGENQTAFAVAVFLTTFAVALALSRPPQMQSRCPDTRSGPLHHILPDSSIRKSELQQTGSTELPNDSRESAIDKDLITEFLAGLTAGEREGLAIWLQDLLSAKSSSATHVKKLQSILESLNRSKVIWPAIKALAKLVKKKIWANSGDAGRAFLLGSGAAILLFGFQGIGVVALGGAIGLPLWIVFGTGSAFASLLLREIGYIGSSRIDNEDNS